MFPFGFDCLYADITKIGAFSFSGNGDIACLFGNYSRKPLTTKQSEETETESVSGMGKRKKGIPRKNGACAELRFFVF